jgi:hypothetical protein
MSFEYRIPKIHIIFILGLSLGFVLGSQGFLDDSFKQNTFTKSSSLVIFIILLFWIIKSPRARHIVINDEGIDIPSILLPPYDSSFINWNEIVDAFTRNLRNGNVEMILLTKTKKFKVKSWLSQGHYEISLYPKNFEKIVNQINQHIDQCP